MIAFGAWWLGYLTLLARPAANGAGNALDWYPVGRLVLWAAETALFQSRLAHAGYVAAPAAAWPESPAAEAFRN